MKLKIGVMGSGLEKSVQHIPKRSLKLAYEVGREIAKQNCILVNGACGGIPYSASKGAKDADGFVMGVSPAENFHEHAHKYKFPTDVYDIIVYTGFGFKGRNVVNVSNCDAVIIIGGHVGTLNEFTIAYDEGMIIGVLQGSGGIADYTNQIIRITNKRTGAIMLYSRRPHEIVQMSIREIAKRQNETEKLMKTESGRRCCRLC